MSNDHWGKPGMFPPRYASRVRYLSIVAVLLLFTIFRDACDSVGAGHARHLARIDAADRAPNAGQPF